MKLRLFHSLEESIIDHPAPLMGQEIKFLKTLNHLGAMELDVALQACPADMLILLNENGYILTLRTIVGDLIILGPQGRALLGYKHKERIISIEVAMQSVYASTVKVELENHGFKWMRFSKRGASIVHKENSKFFLMTSFRCFDPSAIRHFINRYESKFFEEEWKIIVVQPSTRTLTSLTNKYSGLIYPIMYKIKLLPVHSIPTSLEL